MQRPPRRAGGEVLRPPRRSGREMQRPPRRAGGEMQRPPGVLLLMSTFSLSWMG